MTAQAARRALGVAVLLAAAAAIATGVWWRAGVPGRTGARSIAHIDAAAQLEVERGAAFMGQFEFDKAEEAFEAAGVLAPQSWVPQFNRAVARLNQTSEGSQQRAIEMFAPLIGRPATAVRARYCTGLASLYLGEPQAALAQFEAVASARPNDAFAQFYAGQCMELVGRLPEALMRYQRAAEADPLLRSAQLGIQRAAARLNEADTAAAALAQFEALSADPRSSLAEFKYTRMGSLAEVVVDADNDDALPNAAARPAGARAVFAAPSELPVAGIPANFDMRTLPAPTVVDINGDGLQDLVYSAQDTRGGVVCLGTGNGDTWQYQPGHALASVEARGLLWADLDNDGLVDALVNPPNGEHAYALYQNADGTWTRADLAAEPEAEAAPPAEPGAEPPAEPRATAGGPLHLDRALLLADLDQDGDIDVLGARFDEAFMLLNRSDRTWAGRALDRSADAEAGTGGDAAAGRSREAGSVERASAGDLNGDGQLDLILVRRGSGGPVMQLWLAEPLWKWRRARPLEIAEPVRAALACRADNGGAVLLATIVESGEAAPGERTFLAVWRLDATGPSELFRREIPGAQDIAVGPLDGWGEPLVLVTAHRGGPEEAGSAQVFDLRGNTVQEMTGSPTLRLDLAASVVLGAGGTVLIVPAEALGRPPQVLLGGADRSPSVVAMFRGRVDPSQQMRSNASGIGTSYVARAGGRWTAGIALPHATFGGGLQQSLEPAVIGLNGAATASIVSITWPDGVFQGERDMKAGARTIVETQRQISSCPVIFAWNGREHAFVTDCLGVGGMGYLATIEVQPDGSLAPVYAPPRPWERIMLGDARALAPRDGAYDIRLGEPMEEACYLDAARLVAWDVPEGWSMTLDERMGINGPEPTGEVRTYLDAGAPARATVRESKRARDATAERVVDATSELAHQDNRAVHLGEVDARFIGRLASEASLELQFDRALDSHDGSPMLIIDGWVEYPYCQTNFAMWQARAPYQAPTFEALDPATGEWRLLVAEYGYPAGMPRQACFPLPAERIPAGCTTLRIRTTVEVYFDRIRLAWHEPCPGLVRMEAPLQSAECAFAGFPRRVSQPQRRPDYRYAERAPLWDCRMQLGRYTNYGDCTPLLSATDDALAIFGAGEEVRLRFEELPPPAAGTTRTWVLETDGWCKDMDRFTGNGQRVEPLPERMRPRPERVAPAGDGGAARHARDRLHAEFNVRIGGGR